MTERRLPNKLSDLVELALEDLEKVEADDRYVVNMAYWHVPGGETLSNPGDLDTCVVCLGGAVLAGTLSLPHGQHVTNLLSFARDHGLSPHNQGALEALNFVRLGALDHAWKFLHKETSRPEELVEVQALTVKHHVPYEQSPVAFRRWARRAVDALREVGL